MYKAIIADDEIKASKLIQLLGKWEQFGIDIVAVCNDGDDAYKQILKNKPDIVITDIRMPIYNGLQLIEKAKENNIDAAFIIISGYKHFEFAQNALRFGIVDYLLKPIDEKQLNDVLEKTCKQLEKKRQSDQMNNQALQIINNDKQRKRMQLIKEIINGSFAEHPATLSKEELVKKYEFEIVEHGLLQAILLNVENQEILEEGSLFNEKVNALFKKTFSFCKYTFMDVEDIGIWCVVYFDVDNQKKVHEAIKDFYYEVRVMEEIYGNFHPTIGVGTAESEAERFEISFINAKIAERQKMVFENFKINYYKEILQEEIFTQKELKDRIRNLASAIELLQIENVHQWFQSTKKICGESSGKVESINAIKDQIIYTYSDSLKKFKDEKSEQKIRELNRKCYRCGNLDELWSCLEKSIIAFLQKKLEERANSDSRPVQIVKQYVDTHLNESLSLEYVADMVGFTPAYFSAIFKKQTGQTFTEYLTEARIQEAKHLLRTSQKSISEISSMIGYPDDKYFRKLFKKIVGIKASEYRKMYL